MPLTEHDRHDAYEALRETFGERTDVVIELLRPDHEHLATRNDLQVGLAEVRMEMAELRTELKTEMAELRVAFASEINTAFAAQTRTLVIGLVASVVLVALSNALAVLAG